MRRGKGESSEYQMNIADKASKVRESKTEASSNFCDADQELGVEARPLQTVLPTELTRSLLSDPVSIVLMRRVATCLAAPWSRQLFTGDRTGQRVTTRLVEVHCFLRKNS